MSSNYDDNTELLARCQEESATLCRHVECLRIDAPKCGNIGRPEHLAGPNLYLCLLAPDHGGLWHESNGDKWSTCRRHPGCDCPRCHEHLRPPAEPHVCPEPEILIVNEELVRSLQGFLDDLEGTVTPGNGTKYDTLRLILDKMEKGFRIP